MLKNASKSFATTVLLARFFDGVPAFAASPNGACDAMSSRLAGSVLWMLSQLNQAEDGAYCGHEIHQPVPAAGTLSRMYTVKRPDVHAFVCSQDEPIL